MSKTALLGLTKALSAELGPSGITVNALAPGIVPTKFSAALVANEELVSSRLVLLPTNTQKQAVGVQNVGTWSLGSGESYQSCQCMTAFLHRNGARLRERP